MKTEIESKSLLAKYGITTTHPRLATSVAEAEAIVADAGVACALKVVSPDIVHKVAAGGVRLSITPALAAEALSSLMAACRASRRRR